MSRYAGKFITLEGGEGSGKTRLTPLLVEFLRERNYTVFPLREPGGTKISEEIREIIKHFGDDKMNTVTRALLFQAARAQIVQEAIIPRLELGEIVVCDRFFDSTFAYQGYGDGIDLHLLRSLTKLVTKGLTPDITVLLDVDPEIGLARRSSAGGVDAFDSAPIEYHWRVNQAYRMMAKDEPNRWIVVDANKSIELVQEALFTKVINRLEPWHKIEGNFRSVER
jgi:dTMP kinase